MALCLEKGGGLLVYCLKKKKKKGGVILSVNGFLAAALGSQAGLCSQGTLAGSPQAGPTCTLFRVCIQGDACVWMMVCDFTPL